LTVWSEEGVRLCGGTLAFLDGYVAHVYDYWTSGEPVPDDLMLTLELRRSDSEKSPSRFAGLAYFAEGRAWARRAGTMRHELVHLVVGNLDGRSASSLTEGVAGAIGVSDPDSLWTPLSLFDLGAEDFAFSPAAEFIDTGPASQLVRFLIQRHGVERVREVYQTARFEDDAQQIEQAFVDVFGDTLYDDLDDFNNGPQCELQSWECSDLLPERAFPVLLDSRNQGCEQFDDAAGAVAEGDRRWRSVRRFILEVEEPTRVTVDVSDNASVRRTLCFDECIDWSLDVTSSWQDSPTFAKDTPYDTVWPPGRYTVRMAAYDATLPFSVSMVVVDEP